MFAKSAIFQYLKLISGTTHRSKRPHLLAQWLRRELVLASLASISKNFPGLSPWPERGTPAGPCPLLRGGLFTTGIHASFFSFKTGSSSYSDCGVTNMNRATERFSHTVRMMADGPTLAMTVISPPSARVSALKHRTISSGGNSTRPSP